MRNKAVVAKLTSKDHLKLPLISFCPGSAGALLGRLLTKYAKDYYIHSSFYFLF